MWLMVGGLTWHVRALVLGRATVHLERGSCDGMPADLLDPMARTGARARARTGSPRAETCAGIPAAELHPRSSARSRGFNRCRGSDACVRYSGFEFGGNNGLD